MSTATSLVQLARTFAETELRPVALAYDESEEYPAGPLRRAAELGLTSYDLPEAYGGGGIESLVERCAVIEELAWGDSPIAWVIAQGGFFAGPLLALGSAEQKERWLPPLCSADPPATAREGGCVLALFHRLTGARGLLKNQPNCKPTGL